MLNTHHIPLIIKKEFPNRNGERRKIQESNKSLDNYMKQYIFSILKYRVKKSHGIHNCCETR